MPRSDKLNYTPEEMRQWLQREVVHVMKEAELRIRDATDFVTAYTTGKLSAREASGRMDQYDRRWGESTLLGVMPDREVTNEEILRSLDADRAAPGKDWTKHFRERGSRERPR